MDPRSKSLDEKPFLPLVTKWGVLSTAILEIGISEFTKYNQITNGEEQVMQHLAYQYSHSIGYEIDSYMTKLIFGTPVKIVAYFKKGPKDLTRNAHQIHITELYDESLIMFNKETLEQVISRIDKSKGSDRINSFRSQIIRLFENKDPEKIYDFIVQEYRLDDNLNSYLEGENQFIGVHRFVRGRLAEIVVEGIIRNSLEGIPDKLPQGILYTPNTPLNPINDYDKTEQDGVFFWYEPIRDDSLFSEFTYVLGKQRGVELIPIDNY